MYDDSKPSTARLQYLRTVRSHTKPPSNPLPMPWMNSSGSETLAPSGVRRAKSSPSPYYGDLGLKSDPSGSRACSTSSMNAFEALQYDTLTKLVEKRGASINGMRRASKDAVRICTPSMPMPRYTSGSYPASAAEKYVLESGAVPRAESGAAIVLNTSQIIIWRIPQQEAMRMRIDYIWKNLEDCAAFLKEYLERPRTNNTSFSFSFQVDGQTFTAHSTPKQFSSSSAENVSTTFTPEDWHGKFESGADYFTSVPQPNLSRAKSAGTSARSGSPPKRRPTVDTNVDNANIDPEILKQSKSAGAKVSPPLAESTFNAGDWAEHFAPPQPTPARSSRPTTSTRRTKVGSSSSKGPKPRAAAVESDDDDVIFMASRPVSAHSKSKFPTDGAFVGSPNAMDIDPQPTANARKVKVEPSRPEWRSGEPNGTGPEPSAASPEKKLKNRDVSDGELKANFDDFKNTAPFNTLATGLKDFTDLKSSVPFPSKASSAIPIAKGFGSQLNLPKPPRGPDPPAILPDASRPTQAAFDQYVARFGAYMNDWEKFNSQMVTHFNSRKAQVDLFPREWWNQIGDVVLDKYMGGLKEDEEIRTYWDVACGKHKQTVEEFAWAKKVFRDGLQSAGQKTVPLFGEVP